MLAVAGCCEDSALNLALKFSHSLSLSLPPSYLVPCHLTLPPFRSPHSAFLSRAFRKSDVDAEPEESPGSSSSSTSGSSSSGAVDALSTAPAPAPPQASAGEPGQSSDSSCSDTDSSVDSSSYDEEEEEEDDPTMFSSKFLSGANPLSAMSSAVNKFGLFGDEGEGDKNQKANPQQAMKSSGEQQPGADAAKGPRHPLQRSQDLPKQGSPQLHGNGQAGPQKKPSGPQMAPKAGTQPGGQLKAEPQKNPPKGPPQQGSPKPGDNQHILSKSGSQPESPRTSSQQQAPSKMGMQQQGPAKTGAQQEATKTGLQGSAKVKAIQSDPQQRSPKVGQQQQGSPNIGQQQQSSPKAAQQQQAPSKVGQQQQSSASGPRQQGPKGPRTTDLPQAGSTPGATKATSQSKAVAKSLCPVCNTTELNMHTKMPPNHKTCTQCKTEVCSLCGFSPPDSDVSSLIWLNLIIVFFKLLIIVHIFCLQGREWLCLTCQIQRAQGPSKPQGPPMKQPTPSPAAPAKKETSAPGSPQKMQYTSSKVPAKGEAATGPESQRQAGPDSAQRITRESLRGSVSPKQDHTGKNQGSADPAPKQESGGLFGFGGSKTKAARPEESVTGKMFGFGSSIFSSGSTLIASAVQDEPKTPVSPKTQPSKETKPQEKKPEQPQQTKVQQAGQAKAPSGTSTAVVASHNAPKTGQSTCPLCKLMLNIGSKDPPNYNTCTECKCTVCNQCGFNPMPNVKEVRHKFDIH